MNKNSRKYRIKINRLNETLQNQRNIRNKNIKFYSQRINIDVVA